MSKQLTLAANQAALTAKQTPLFANQTMLTANQSPLLPNQLRLFYKQRPLSRNQVMLSPNQTPLSLNQRPLARNQARLSVNQPTLRRPKPTLAHPRHVSTVSLFACLSEFYASNAPGSALASRAMHTDLGEGVLWYAVFLFSTVFHEAAHAWSALKLGDDTAARGGQVSLNPLPHIKREPVGMVVIPILTWFLGGWIMGWASAPYDAEWARRSPRRAALMALAGPTANLLLVAGAALLIRLGVEWHVFTAPYSFGFSRVAVAVNSGPLDFAAKLLSIVFSLNLLLCLFNLLPIPPLDGSSLPLLALPERAARSYFDTMRSPALQLIGFLIVSRGLGAFFPPILFFAASLLYGGARHL